MKRAKKYTGIKVRRSCDFSSINMENYVEEFNTIDSFDNFKNSLDNEDYNVELLEKNLTLYKCTSVDCEGNLGTLCDIRNKWAKGIFNYQYFYTKNEIVNLLNKGFLVAVEGLQEIDLADIDKLV